LEHRVQALETERTAAHCTIHWQFTSRDARTKLADLYPVIQTKVDKLLLSPNTVLKAYRELELEGLISSRQGVGTFVLRTLVDPLLTGHAALLRRLVRWMHDAQQAGLGEEDIDALIANARQAVFPQEEVS
jgi:GntR family transcriptional regulator